jgi:GNAT superfamily N-acetyltransferase
MPALVTEPLGTQHLRKEFSCGEDVLDVYLKRYATQDQKRRVAAVFVLPDDDLTVKGYYSLSSTNISSIDLPEKLLRKLPKHPHQPATLLGRLAVDRRNQKQGIGEILLLDALCRSYILSEQIGSIAMVVDALNRNVSEFYQQYGFIPLPDQSKLFMPMKTIRQLFKQ